MPVGPYSVPRIRDPVVIPRALEGPGAPWPGEQLYGQSVGFAGGNESVQHVGGLEAGQGVGGEQHQGMVIEEVEDAYLGAVGQVPEGERAVIPGRQPT